MLRIIFATLLLASVAQGQTIVHVDHDAPGPLHNGANWETAFTDLQDALAVATYGDEIRVAGGTYKPDRGSGDRGATFQLVDGVVLSGGYAGYGEPKPNAQNASAYETILNGDLADDDIGDWYDPTRLENTVCVVAGDSLAGATLLRGFTVSGGVTSTSGAGIRLSNASNPTIIACTFDGNYSFDAGGGMANIQSDPLLIRCVFRSNAAFREGGAITNWNASPALHGCIFNGNATEGIGGAISSSGYGSPLLVGCTITHNTVRRTGAYGAIYHGLRSDPLVMHNCIVWGNTGPAQIGPDVWIEYSTVEGWDGGWGGVWNDGRNPLFVDADGLDGIPGTKDDNLRLSAGSPCIDTGDNQPVPNWVIADLDGDPRFMDDPASYDRGHGTPPIVDRGAYEYQDGGCETAIIVTDLDGDCDVDLADYALFQLSFTGPN